MIASPLRLSAHGCDVAHSVTVEALLVPEVDKFGWSGTLEAFCWSGTMTLGLLCLVGTMNLGLFCLVGDLEVDIWLVCRNQMRFNFNFFEPDSIQFNLDLGFTVSV